MLPPSIPMVATEPQSEKLRLQLSTVGERFAGFKSSIAEDSRKKRLLEEERYRKVLDHLITRCEKLEQELSSLKGEEAKNLSVRNQTLGIQRSAELMTRCRAIRAAFKTEIGARNEREEAAANKLEALSKNLDFKIDSEIAARHQQLAAIKRDVEILLRGEQPHEQFHNFVKEELAELRESLAAATRTREEADDEILQAITEYTTALQKGLQIAGGMGRKT